jgi:hypothetical protein
MIENNGKTYCKTLTKSEAKYRYWRILKSDRNFFPEENIEFKVKFAGKISTLKVNYRDNMMVGQLYEKYRFLENDRIIFTKQKGNTYSMESPDTKLWPAI